MLIDDKILDDLTRRAQNSPRRRMNLNFHESLEDKCHRFLNAVEPRADIPIHRHPEKEESFVGGSGGQGIRGTGSGGQRIRGIGGSGDQGDRNFYTQYIDLWSSSSLQGIAQASLDSALASFVTSLTFAQTNRISGLREA